MESGTEKSASKFARLLAEHQHNGNMLRTANMYYQEALHADRQLRKSVCFNLLEPEDGPASTARAEDSALVSNPAPETPDRQFGTQEEETVASSSSSQKSSNGSSNAGRAADQAKVFACPKHKRLAVAKKPNVAARFTFYNINCTKQRPTT